jgi:hypothetical protein
MASNKKLLSVFLVLVAIHGLLVLLVPGYADYRRLLPPRAWRALEILGFLGLFVGVVYSAWNRRGRRPTDTKTTG